MNLIVVGINHRNADVEMRERFAVARDDLSGSCQKLVACSQITEAVVISTCNRVEVYCSAAPEQHESNVIAAIHATLGSNADDFYTLRGAAALKHLMRVSASLDSMVLGEPQILGQVKEAFAIAQEAQSVSTHLYQAFTTAFRTAKKVRSETAIAEASVSVGHVAVELARTIFGSLEEVKVLLVGAGKMGVLAAGKLAQSGARKVLVINRTYRKATELAMAHEWTASVYEDLALLLSDVDVVICSTGARQAVLTHDMVKAAAKKRRYRPLFLIDIAVPRDIDSKCSQVNDVYLYNIDDLEEVSRTNAELRQSELTAAEVIIEDQLHSIQNRQSEQIAGPIIARLREYSQRLANAEAQKTCRMIPQLDDKGAKAVQKLATVIANRMIGNSITLLKNAADSAELEELATMVEQLFELGDSDDLGNGDDGEVDGGVDGDTAKADAGEKSRHELHELHDMNDENPPPPVDLGSGNESR